MRLKTDEATGWSTTGTHMPTHVPKMMIYHKVNLNGYFFFIHDGWFSRASWGLKIVNENLTKFKSMKRFDVSHLYDIKKYVCLESGFVADGQFEKRGERGTFEWGSDDLPSRFSSDHAWLVCCKKKIDCSDNFIVAPLGQIRAITQKFKQICDNSWFLNYKHN